MDGITCQLRTNPLPSEEVVRRAVYCSQPLVHIALELEPPHRVSMRMDVRARHGEVRSLWRNFFGTTVTFLSGVARVEDVKRLAEPYVREVAERRRKMGK